MQNGKIVRLGGDEKQSRRRLLPMLCYLLTAVLALGGCGLRLARDARDRRSGALTERALTLADFEQVNAHTEGETVLVSDNEDPQLIYTAVPGQRLDRLRAAVTYDKYPYERCLYYVTAPGEAFGQEKRVWAVEQPDGSLIFSLPRGVTAIRLDPGSRNALRMDFSALVLNEQRPAKSYFLPDGGTAFALLAGPGLAAAVIQWAADFVAAWKTARAGQGGRRGKRG